MQRNCKKLSSFILALILVISVFALPFGAFAANYTETVEAFSYNGYEIPAFDGDLYEEINGNVPKFTSSELNQTIEEHYGELDGLKRVTKCWANIDQSLMPAEGEKRGEIGTVKPTGFKQNKYDFVSGKYLYNRSHLIGWQLTGENANEKNLMTGTRTFNAVGMLKFENEVASYIKEDSENNVLYRVTPVFQGDNLLASGVIMEAESVDDLGKSVSFCVFVYNVENGVAIDYATGENIESGAEVPKTDLSYSKVWLKGLNFTYTGKEIKPLEYVECKGVRLTEGTDYTVSYSDNVNAGSATVTVTGINSYTGSATKSFSIYNPKPKKTVINKLKAKKKAFTVKWKKVSGISGYQIQYSTNKKFKKAKTVTVNSTKAKTKTVKKKIKSKKKYFVRIRTYKTVNRKKFYSDWSRYKSVKVK